MLLTLAFLLFTPPSLAGSQSERDAEAIRLVAEVERLGQKLAWSGVERNYASLVELKGVTVPRPPTSSAPRRRSNAATSAAPGSEPSGRSSRPGRPRNSSEPPRGRPTST